jgi:sugar O-acyltransferase (sialic acid O-acetyltransferase NeuD family)
MKKIAFIGSGEMARHIAHYMVEDNQFEIAGYYDDFTPVGTIVNSYPILGTLDDLETQFKLRVFDELINAIGFTRMQYRKEVFERFEKDVPFATFIHSSCLVDSTAKIGKGVVVFPFCILYLDSVIEDDVFIQIRSYVTDSRVKKHTMISGTVSIAGRSEIGECCNIGITTTVNDDIKICDFVRTGSGSVVTRNITEPGTYVGVPARKISDKI